MPNSESPRECCIRTVAGDREAMFCGDCGAPIVRCMAFEDCGGLAGQDGLCRACVNPVLEVDREAVREARVGGVMTLPFKLTNASTAGRPLFVPGTWVRTGNEPRRAAELLWERLDAGETAPIPVRTSILAETGVHSVELVFSAESRFRWRSERFLFAASLDVRVRGDQASTIHQTINLRADVIEPGATVYAPIRAEHQAQVVEQPRIDLQLVRAGRLELEMGLRGVEGAWRLPRTIPFRWQHFGEGEAPHDGPMNTQEGILAIGRARAKQHDGSGDVRILAWRDGALDEEVSLMISRRHCEVFVQNDRLMIRANGDAGLLVDDTFIGRGESAVIRSGTTISMLRKYPDAAAIRFDIEIQHGLAEKVTVTRLNAGGRVR